MSYPHRPYHPPGQDDDVPSSNRPAPSRGQTLHSTGPYNLSSMPRANSIPQIYNPGGNFIGEQNISGNNHRYSNPAPVTGRQQPHDGQHPHSASSMSPSALPYSYNPHGTASTPHLPPHQCHLGGLQQGPLNAQGDSWRDVDPLPPELKKDYASYAQGSGYWNMYNARQDDGSITHNALGNANEGIGDVHSSKGDSSSQSEPLESSMMPFDANANTTMMPFGGNADATMNMSNTAPPGEPLGPFIGIIPEEENAIFQTPHVNTGYEPSGVPTYDTHTFGQPSEASTPTYPAHRPLQPLHPKPPEESVNERRHLGSTSALTHGQPLRRHTPSRGSRPRKERKLATMTHYEKDRKAHVKTNDLACDPCKARKTRVRL